MKEIGYEAMNEDEAVGMEDGKGEPVYYEKRERRPSLRQIPQSPKENSGRTFGRRGTVKW